MTRNCCRSSFGLVRTGAGMTPANTCPFAWSAGGRHGEGEPVIEGLHRGRRPQRAVGGLGLCGRPHVLDEGGRRRAGLSNDARRLRGLPRYGGAGGIVRRFERALRQLDDSFRLYQYLIKRPALVEVPSGHSELVVHDALRRRAAFLQERAEALFEYDTYAVLLYEGWRSGAPGAVRVRSPFGGTRRHAAEAVCRAGM